jgi:hypothetical protein
VEVVAETRDHVNVQGGHDGNGEENEVEEMKTVGKDDIFINEDS